MMMSLIASKIEIDKWRRRRYPVVENDEDVDERDERHADFERLRSNSESRRLRACVRFFVR